MEEQSDESIALDAQAGDLQAFGLLVDRYAPKMGRYAQKFLFGYDDAQDAIQEVFIKAYRNIKSFDTSRRFSPWLYRIAHNEFINIIKKKGREPISLVELDTIVPYPASHELADKTFDDAIVKHTLEENLKTLDPKYREPLILFYFEDLDYNQISAIMRIPVATVGVRLRRGRALLHTLYTKNQPV